MQKNRLYFFYGFLLISFLVLVARLFELQIIFGSQNRIRAEGNRIRKLVSPAPRGIIFDREKRPLVQNVPVYRVKQSSHRAIEPSSGESFKTITREEALAMEAKGEVENLKTSVGRGYVYGSVLAHVLGFLGEANPKEVAEGEYQLGDLVGRTGIEEQYDGVLRGQDGGEIFEVDHLERKTRVVGEVKPVPGQDIFLSLDAELSKTASEALGGLPGAVVATEAKTGQVLVLVSSPSFDPNSLGSEEMRPANGAGRIGKWESWLVDPLKPLFNRAIGGAYPPGSTFKIVSAAAGIEEGKVDAETTYEDAGEIKVGDYRYRNWYFTQYGRVEGEINIVQALKRSTDTFFYKVGEWVGATRLSEWAKAFGLGRKTKIDIPGEITGLVPDPEWKKETKGESWFLGNTYHLAIGQADLLTTPFQVNMMTSVIANEGKLCQPRIIQGNIRNISDIRDISGAGDTDCQDLHLKPETLRLIKEGMKEACLEGGTAFPFFDFSPRVACKTGTAEFSDPQNRTHAWLTAFAPADDPEIVVTALVEAGGEGSHVAAPIVKKVMEKWFRQ